MAEISVPSSTLIAYPSPASNIHHTAIYSSLYHQQSKLAIVIQILDIYLLILFLQDSNTFCYGHILKRRSNFDDLPALKLIRRGFDCDWANLK